MTTEWTAVSLPDGSVVAIGRDVYLKRIIQPGTPGHEEFWIAAMTFGVPLENWPMQRRMDRDGFTIMRVGDGTDTATLRQTLDWTLAEVLPAAGPRVAEKIRALQAELAAVDEHRARLTRG